MGSRAEWHIVSLVASAKHVGNSIFGIISRIIDLFIVGTVSPVNMHHDAVLGRAVGVVAAIDIALDGSHASVNIIIRIQVSSIR